VLSWRCRQFFLQLPFAFSFYPETVSQVLE